jgi:gliding motility-associated-like protein
VINHNDQSFSKLTISGGGEKRFLANITIENELNLSEGVLVSSNDAKIIFSSTAKITGGSDDAYIVGTVYHKGAGQKLFPVGDGNHYLPVTLTNIEGASAEVGVRVVDMNNTSIPLKKEVLLTAISNQRYWELDVISGSISNSKAILPVVDENIVTSETLAVVAESDDLSNEFRNLGHDTDAQSSNDRVTSNNFISMRFLAVGAKKETESVFVYNAISPNGDDKNGVLTIDNIESFPDNKVSLFNRWGDKVFEMMGYDNDVKVFVGKKNIGSDEELSAGTYYYVIYRRAGLPLVNGYLTLKK